MYFYLVVKMYFYFILLLLFVNPPIPVHGMPKLVSRAARWVSYFKSNMASEATDLERLLSQHPTLTLNGRMEALS